MKYKLNFLALIAISLISLYGCKEKNVDPVEEAPLPVTLGDINANNAFTLGECDLEKEMVLYPFAPTNGTIGEDDNNTVRDALIIRIPFDRIFYYIGLSDAQTASIKDLNQKYIKCLESVLLGLFESLQAIVKNANIKRSNIIRAYREGKITREEASLEMRKLNKETRIEISESKAVNDAQINMKKCRRIFLEAIIDILTADQQKIWDKYIGWANG